MLEEFRSLQGFAPKVKMINDNSVLPLGLRRFPFDGNAQMSKLPDSQTPKDKQNHRNISNEE